MRLILIATFLFFACNNTSNLDVFNRETKQDCFVQKNRFSIEDNTSAKKLFTENEIKNIINRIDSLRETNKLNKIYFPNKTIWGHLEGDCLEDELVFLNAVSNAELGFQSKIFYLYKNNIIKMIYHKHIANWGEYEEKYPTKKIKFDSSKMTYTDITYTIILSEPECFTHQLNHKIISTKIDKDLIDTLINNGQEMIMTLMKQN